MKHIDIVSAEGGPLLIADAGAARYWRGGSGDAEDYRRACALLEADPAADGRVMRIGNMSVLIWEMEGAGTADVYVASPSEVLVVRSWLEDDEDEERVIGLLAAAPAVELTRLGRVEMMSGVCAVLWAVESGSCIESMEVEERARPTGEMAMEESGLLLRVTPGVYECFHDTARVEGGTARRCRLRLLG